MSESERRPLLRGVSSDSDTASPLQPWRTKFACVTVLLTEMFERVAFYGITCNLVMFLNLKPLGWSSDQSLDALYFFMGMSYISSLFGGFIADAGLNRFRTIIVFLVIYLCGYIFFPLLVPPTKESVHPTICSGENCKRAVYFGMTIVAIGVGGVKANIAPFGADQVKHQSPHIHRMFFNWFYWSINIGAFLAVGVLGAVQQDFSFFWGYVIPNVCVLLALVVFLIGSSVYIKKPASGSVLTNICQIFCESCRICCRKRKHPVMLSSNASVDIAASSSPTTSPGWIDYAKVRYGGSFQDSMVEDVKSLGKIFAVFLSMIPYWLVYFQMESTYVVQGLHMKLDFSKGSSDGEHHIKIAVAWLSLFDVIFLLLLLPLLDLVVYPFLDKRGYSLSVRARIITGMVFAVFSVLIAGVVETVRLQDIWGNGTMNVYKQYVDVNNISRTLYNASHMSVLWQIPQYTLIGVSEAFASVAGLELAYMYAPRSMKTIIMGLFWFTQGLGSLLGIGCLSMFKGYWFFNWERGDINCRRNCYRNITDNHTQCYPVYEHIKSHDLVQEGSEKDCHLDYYFFFLGALQVVGIALFVWISWALNIGGRSRKTNNTGTNNNNNNATTRPTSNQNHPKYPSKSEDNAEGEVAVRGEHGTSASGVGMDMANGGMSNIQRRVIESDSTPETP